MEDQTICGGVETDSLAWAHPLVRDWFLSKFGSPTEPQALGWPHIVKNRSTLISAPTGSGKTLAAFLACIDRLVRKAVSEDLQDETEVLYVSPLKALGNDIQRNLNAPLSEIMQLAHQRGYLMPEIRTAVRTGDTLAHERRAMQKRPPHILVTTPESLYILLTAGKSREWLRTVKTVIVDEIHAIADDKRGAHLALSLERLEALTRECPTRIGLSATQKPMDLIGQFLVGNSRPQPVFVHIPQRREIDLAVEVPGSELGAVASNEMWEEIYQRLAELVQQSRSTLVFINTRRLAERVAHNLARFLGEDAVASHHGSLSRHRRLAVEGKLKAGEIRALIATASLELGIDIGTVDLVCQIGSPRAIAVALQRVGRAGHWRGAVPKGRLFATTRDELVECAALVRAIRHGDLDRIEIPQGPLDILAQQIVAACAAEDWQEDELFALVRRAFHFRNLSRSEFDEIVSMLSEGIAARRGRYGAYLHHDQVSHRLRGRRGSRLAAITSGGAIPDNALYTVIAEPEAVVVGTVDEDFAVESLRGDIILLGNNSWRIRRVQSGSVLVEDAKGAPPNVPFWRGEAPSRTPELSQQVAELREIVSSHVNHPSFSHGDQNPIEQSTPKTSAPKGSAIDWLMRECGLDQSGAEQVVEYILAGRAVLGAVPTQRTIVAERFFDESGGMQLVIHAPFGGRINKAWGLSLRKRFCRSFNFELQAAATDNGLNISLSEQHSFPLSDVFRFLHAATVEELLEQAVLDSPIFATRWRWAAGRALALLRFTGGKKVPPQIQRMRSDDLLAAVFPQALACQENIAGEIVIPHHPLVREAMKDSLTEAMDVAGLKEVLSAMASGEIQCLAVDTPVPSQFSHEILNANPYAYLDDAPLEERRARAVEMRRVLPESILSEIGRLDPNAISEVRKEAWPDVRSADELHDVLQAFVAFPEAFRETLPFAMDASSVAGWAEYFGELVAGRRAARARVNHTTYWVVAEKVKQFLTLLPGALLDAEPAGVPTEDVPRDDVLSACVGAWLSHSGPITCSALSRLLGLSAPELDQALLRLEASGSILRGHFTQISNNEIEWCDRRLLARIHRLTVGTLRKQVEPVTAAQFMSWLFRWQHVAPGSQLFGERGTFEILRQLQGFEAPANAWENRILQRRVANYDAKMLDQLCLSGAVGWGRLSPHPSMTAGTEQIRRRIAPSSVAPITFFIREEADWMIPRAAWAEESIATLSQGARDVLQCLRQRGASFFAEIVRSTKLIKAEAEGALWELVSAGMITADGFDNIRAMIDPRRRAGKGKMHSARPRHSVGRWSMLRNEEMTGREQTLEAMCRLLLGRYGVVFREILTREYMVPRWRELLITYRRLEDRGEIRGGRFVSGFLGEQFALPVAIESLRAARKYPASGDIVTISAADPLNLVGILVPGERVSPTSLKNISFLDGVFVSDESQNTPSKVIIAGVPLAARVPI